MVVIAAAETWLDRQPSELFLSGLQKSEFGRCSLFPSWSGQGLISTPNVYCFSLHVSGNYMPIIRRKYRTYVTPGICHSETCRWFKITICNFKPSTSFRVTNTWCRIGTVFSPDDGHVVEKSNKHIKKICAPSWFYFQKIHQNQSTHSRVETWTSRWRVRPDHPSTYSYLANYAHNIKLHLTI